MRDKRFFETQGRPSRRRSHPPAPSPTQLSRPAFLADGAAIDATPARLRKEFGRCNDDERAQLRDMRIEKNRLAAITKSDRAVRRHVIAMAKLERELAGVTFRLTARVHEKKRAVPTTRRKRVDMPPQRRLPAMGIAIVDRAGRRGVFVEVTSVGANQAHYRPGCARLHLNYIWAENAVERLDSGAMSRCSNMGETPEQVAAAMDLKEDVARASRANANIEIRIIVRLPDDISPEARLAIIHGACEDFFGRNGLPYAAAVHPPDRHSDDRNFHGHIQASFRPMRHVGGDEWDVATELRTDLSRPEGMRLLRAVVAHTMTEECRKEGLQRTYTSLSNQERGLALKPLKKVGREQTEAYRRGEYVGVVEENVRTIAENIERYAAQRAQWLTEKLTASHVPPREAPNAPLNGPLSDLPCPAGMADVETADPAGEPRRASLSALFKSATGEVFLVLSRVADQSRAILPCPVLQGFDASTAAQVHAAIVRRPGLGGAGGSILAELGDKAAASAVTRPSIQPLSPVPFSLPCLGNWPDRVLPAHSTLLTPTLPVAPLHRAGASDINDALLLFQLRAAQKKERERLAIKRQNLLGRHLFQRGNMHEPTPEYAAFLLAIRNDPTLLRWELGAGGKRRAPVAAKQDEAFADRFAVYMEHFVVRRQVEEIFNNAYTPITPWPPDLASGMWRYEAGRHSHHSAEAARASWVETDADFRRKIERVHPASPILETFDGVVVPAVHQTSRWRNEDLVRLLFPSNQQLLAIAYHDQQEERAECLAAIASSTAQIERRLLLVSAGSVRPVTIPNAVPAALADAFLRWRDDADFYLDAMPDSAAIKAAVERVSGCADPHRRALEAARDAGRPPAVLRLLEGRLTTSQSARRSAYSTSEARVMPESSSQPGRLVSGRKDAQALR